jgi:hypothetical protein
MRIVRTSESAPWFVKFDAIGLIRPAGVMPLRLVVALRVQRIAARARFPEISGQDSSKRLRSSPIH